VQRSLTYDTAGASLDTSDEHFLCTCCGNVTALIAAQEVAIVERVLAAGASARTANNRGNTCLHVAAVHKHPAPVICLLIKAGAVITAVSTDGMTAAEVAHEHGTLLVIALLKRAAKG
jgi:ankyrin repeat protein